MGKEWEKTQLDKLVASQQNRIDKLRQQFLKEETQIAKSQAYNEQIAEKEKPKKKASKLTVIVAAGEGNAIGKDNALIWHLSDDLKRFKSLTSGHTLIMGRKTFESFPQPLPNRKHIVITHQDDYNAPSDVTVVNSITDAFDAARNAEHVFVIGGGEIYEQVLPFVDTIELTRVHHTFDGADTFFPELDLSIWEQQDYKLHKKDNEHKYDFSFVTYIRK